MRVLDMADAIERRIPHDERFAAGPMTWTPLLVFMRLRLMVDVNRRDKGTGGVGPTGYRCSMPEPARLDWADQRGYEPALHLPPPKPSPEEQRLADDTVLWLSALAPTDRVIVWGAALGQSWRVIAGRLRHNAALGCDAISHVAARRRWFQLLEALALHWSAHNRPVDPLTRTAAQSFAYDDTLRRRGFVARPQSHPHNDAQAMVNGEPLSRRRIVAAEVPADSLRKADPLFDQVAWDADRPRPKSRGKKSRK